MTSGERGQLPCEVGCARVGCGGKRTGGTTTTERRKAIQSLSAVTVWIAARGLPRLVTRQRTIGFGKIYPAFWINLREAMPHVAPKSGVHICLRAKTTAEIDAFHAAALATGSASDGAPGIRPHDRVRYYAAFILDPDGNRIEAVTFLQE